MTTRSFCSAEDAVICQAVLDVQSLSQPGGFAAQEHADMVELARRLQCTPGQAVARAMALAAADMCAPT
jgi:hypothetical protein